MALGTVGGTLRVHPAARLSLQMLQITSAQELATVATCVGMASNLAAIRALATDGIQRGHGAARALGGHRRRRHGRPRRGRRARICELGDVTVDSARAVLAEEQARSDKDTIAVAE